MTFVDFFCFCFIEKITKWVLCTVCISGIIPCAAHQRHMFTKASYLCLYSLLSTAGHIMHLYPGHWERLMSDGTSRTCFSRYTSLERLTSSPLCFSYLYAWPDIFPGQWLNTRWQRPLQPPLLRSRHGQCRAAPERWDLKKDREINKKSRWRHLMVRWGSEGRATAKDRQNKSVQGGKRRLFTARSCSNDRSELLSFLSPLTSCSQSRAA